MLKMNIMDTIKSESKIQQEICLWYKNSFCLKHHKPRSMIFSIPNEGRGAASMQLMATGLYPGAADIAIIHGHCLKTCIDSEIRVKSWHQLLFIEVKTPSAYTGPRKNGQSQKQIDFEDHCKEMEIQYHIVLSLEDFKSVINNL